MAWTLARGSDQYLGCRSAQFLPQYGMGVLGRQEGGCGERVDEEEGTHRGWAV